MTLHASPSHLAVAVLGHLRAEVAERLLTDAWQDISLHMLPTGRDALRARLSPSTCLWFVSDVLPDMSGWEFIQLTADIGGADRFVLIAQEYDERSDRRFACMTRTTYCVSPLVTTVFQELMASFLAIPAVDRPP